MKTVSATLKGPADTSGASMIETNYKYDQVNMSISDIARPMAEDFIKVRGLSEIRAQLRKYKINGRLHSDTDRLTSELHTVLDMDIIYSMYCNLQANSKEFMQAFFARKAYNALSAIMIHAAFEVASRILGITYETRKSANDWTYRQPSDLTSNTDTTLSIVGLLNSANVQITHTTLTIAMLPFIDMEFSQSEVGVLLSTYHSVLRKYLGQLHDNKTYYTVIMKLVGTIDKLDSHKRARIVAFTDDNFTYAYRFSSALFTNMRTDQRKLNTKMVEDMWAENTVAQKLTNYYNPTPPVKQKPERWTHMLSSLFLGAVDWLWRMRMQWTGAHAVGSRKTLTYGEVMHRKERSEATFNYTNNRYLLETLGQVFIGQDAMPIDRKWVMFRDLAKDFLSLVERTRAEELWSDEDWNELVSFQYLTRMIEHEEGVSLQLMSFVTTMDILLKEFTRLSVFHVMSAMIYFAKHQLNDVALRHINVDNTTDVEDIKLWVEYDLG